MAKRIDVNAVPVVTGCKYPAPFDVPCAARRRQCLGDAAGLTDFGVNLLRLPPGTWSSQRHWHSHEDEFVHVLEGEVVLVTDAGEELLRAGDSAGFKAGERDGHHLQNRSARDAVVLEVGSRKVADDEGDYPDIDLYFLKGDAGYAHKDGTPYPARLLAEPRAAEPCVADPSAAEPRVAETRTAGPSVAESRAAGPRVAEP